MENIETSENLTKKDKENTLKEDFKFAQFVYAGLYISLMIAFTIMYW
tara:strand:+ start:633 stop:773 length:141 start_codon:yes stop_codon:yes gene_type:complete